MKGVITYENRFGEMPLEEVKPACEAVSAIPGHPAELVDLANHKAIEALFILRRINQHLFGVGNADERKVESPSCLFDALVIHDCTVTEIMETVKILADRLGL